MNTPNPLIPQGTFPENRGRSQIRIAVFTILAVHVVLLGSLLMAGCKKTAETELADKATNNYPPVVLPPDTNGSITATTPAVTNVPVVVNPPVAPTVTPPVETAAGTEHVVMKGDSFFTLAKKYNVTSKAIAEVNPGVDSAKLKIGQKLKIPAATTGAAATAAHSPAGSSGSSGPEQVYVVKSGDNLMKIAKNYAVSVKALRSVNALKTDQIKVGQKIKIPAKTAAEPASAGVSAGSVPSLTATNPSP
jgi:LysM repeat protein